MDRMSVCFALGRLQPVHRYRDVTIEYNVGAIIAEQKADHENHYLWRHSTIMSTRFFIRTLGYLGLIPFIIPAALVATNSVYSDFAIQIVETYAFGIICFLTGSWWGMSSAIDNRALIFLSNLYFVTAFLLLFLAPLWWSFAASVLLISIFALEQKKSLFPPLPQFYCQMRAILTIFSSCSMLVVHITR
jgi:hypothetical protein